MRIPAINFLAILTSASLLAAGQTPATVPAVDRTGPDANPPSITDAVATVREGTHLVNLLCQLTRTADNQQAVVKFQTNPATPDSPVRTSPVPSAPMIVLPNQNLAAMESVLSARGAGVQFRVSGTVTEYKARNYILLDSVETTLLQPKPAPKSAAVAAVTPRINNTLNPAGDQAPADSQEKKPPTVENEMHHLLTAPAAVAEQLPTVTDGALPSHTAQVKPAVAPDAPPVRLLREGRYLTNQIGRLNHSPDGRQATFTFDADGKTMQDPPLIILPNSKLSAMDGAVVVRASDVHFRISGKVTEYKGKNYILLDKAVVTADVEAQF
jgi:hypothetical protein